VNWNGLEHTLACLEAVQAQLGDVEDALVTVVDNGSTDGSIAAITSRFPRARFLPLGENRGFTGGISAALLSSTARNVIFLNNDAIPEPGWLAAMVGAIDAAPDDVLSVGGKIVDLSGTLIDFIGGALTFDGHAFQPGFRMPLDARPEPAAGEELLFACGGNMISRRLPLMELGGFDDDYFAYLEDVDFGWRSWIAGKRVVYEPHGLARHASSATSDRLGNFERGVLFERNALQTVLKNYETGIAAAALAPVFYTYLSRLHHYATTRNAGAAELTRPPFAGRLAGAKQRTLRSRLTRKLRGPQALASIDDPLTAMQFRALDWILRHQARIVEKRDAVQRTRRRPDAEIFARFPLHYVPTYPGDESLMQSALFGLLRSNLPSVDRRLDDMMRT
jgi:GT2 family glycosyltransferase